MYGYDLRLSDEPGDIVHIDTSGPCTEEELEALTEYFRLVFRRTDAEEER